MKNRGDGEKVDGNIDASNIGKKIIDALSADQGGLLDGRGAQKKLRDISRAAETFISKNPKVKLTIEDLQEIVGGDIDSIEEKYGRLKGFSKLNSLLESYFEEDMEMEDFTEEDGNKFMSHLLDIWGIDDANFYNDETGDFDEDSRKNYEKMLVDAMNKTDKSANWFKKHLVEAAEAESGDYDTQLEKVWRKDEDLDNVLKVVRKIGDNIDG